MKTNHKAIWGVFKLHYIKWLIILLMAMIGVSLSTGLGATSYQLKNGFNQSFKQLKFPDIQLKSVSQFGFDQEDIDKIYQIDAQALIREQLEIDMNQKRLIYTDFSNDKRSNHLVKVQGEYPVLEHQVMIEKPHSGFKAIAIGDTIEIFGSTKTVVGYIENTIFAYKDKITNLEGSAELDTIVYMDKQFAPVPLISDLYITFDHNINVFESDYETYIREKIESINQLFDEQENVILTHQEMIIPVVVKANIEKMQLISIIFPIFFLVVIMIVTLATMGKMIDDERLMIGTYVSLGYYANQIKIKYYLFAFSAVILGSIAGLFIGFYTLATLVYESFDALLRIPLLTSHLYLNIGILASLVILIGVLLMTFIRLKGVFKDRPAELLRLKSPKPGKKIIIEYLPFIWKRLKFKYKSSLRNMFRYPLNFLMTVLSILGSTVLLFAGFSLYENTIVLDDISASSIRLIALIITISSAFLSILVTYNLTNMNIDNRKREIASLKVLGYGQNEVAFYIYREVMMMSTLGIIIGLPLGYVLIDVIFNYIGYGSIENVSFITWISTLICSYIFLIVTQTLLYPKINKIKMSESLKTMD